MTPLLFVTVLAAAAPAPEEPKPAATLAEALDNYAAGKGKLDRFRLDVTWAGNVRTFTATVHGSGVGILNNEKQFAMTKEQVVDLVKQVQKARFAEMKESSGGRGRPGAGVPERLVGSVSVRADGHSKGVTQLDGGEQNEALAKLAVALLDACTAAAKDGVTADSLADGLKKIAKKDLDPLTLELLVHRLIEDKNAKDEGFLMRVTGSTVVTRTNTPGKGYGKPVKLELTRKQLEDLTQLLVANDPAGFPVNLWAKHYTDFNVKVLNREKNLQARQFANLKPDTHGEKQKQFDRVFDGLYQLHLRALKEGKETSEAN